MVQVFIFGDTGVRGRIKLLISKRYTSTTSKVSDVSRKAFDWNGMDEKYRTDVQMVVLPQECFSEKAKFKRP